MSSEPKSKHDRNIKFHDDPYVNARIHDDITSDLSWTVIEGMIPLYEKQSTEGSENYVRERFLRVKPEPVKQKPAFESLDPLWRSLQHLPQRRNPPNEK